MKRWQRLARLAGEALASPSSLSSLAWALPLPLVVMDSAAAPLLLQSTAGVASLLLVVMISVGAYGISWLVYRGADHLRGRAGRARTRILVASGALATAGAAWFVGLRWGIDKAGDVARTLPPDLWRAGVGGAVIQMIFGTLVAIVLVARATSHREEQRATEAERALLDGVGRLRTVRAAARSSLAAWIDDVLQPGVHRVRSRLALLSVPADADSVAMAVAQLDDFREETVRRGSHGLHPRLAGLGLQAALVFVGRNCGYDDIRVRIDGDGPSEVQAGCLTRVVDILLSAGPPRAAVSIHIVEESRGWTMTLTGVEADPDGLPMCEVEARLREHGGTIVVVHESSTVTITIAQDVDIADDVDVAALWSVPVVSAVTLLPISVLLLGMLGLEGGQVAAGGLAGLSVAGYAWLMQGRMASVGARAWGDVLAVGTLTALTMSGALWLVGVRDQTVAAAVLFTMANACAVIALVALAVTARELISRWEGDVRRARGSTRAARLQAMEAAREIDVTRERVATLLHSRVQARLVAATGRLLHDPLRADDLEQARLAVEVIDVVDVPALRRAVERPTSGTDLATVLAEFDDIPGLDLHAEAAARVDPLAATRIADVVREAVANAVVHGGASRIDVLVESVGRDYVVRIEDDGRGVPASVRNGLGSAVIAAASDGRWELRSRAEGGARLTASVGR